MLGRSSAEKLQQGVGYKRVSRQATAVPLLHSASGRSFLHTAWGCQFSAASYQRARGAPIQAKPLNAKTKKRPRRKVRTFFEEETRPMQS